MKILIVQTKAFNPNEGGVQKVTFKLGKFFHENGLKVFYYSTLLNGHIECLYGHLYHSPYSGSVGNEQNIQHFITTIKEIQPDIIFNQMPYEKPLRNALQSAKNLYPFKLVGCLNNSLFSFKNNIKEILKAELPNWLFPIVNNKVGIEFFQIRHKKMHGSELREIINLHDIFVLPTPRNFDELDYFISDYDKEKVTAIPNSINGIDLSSRSLVKERTLLFIGRMNVQQKRADLLIKVWNLLYKELPEWKFVLVGDGPFLPTLKEEARELKIERIFFEGFQFERPDIYYRAASILIMPSSYEGFPNVLLEAQSFGIVPVAFNSYAAVSWILNDTVDSFLINPYDIHEMAMKIKKLAINSDLLHEMRLKAFENAERFSMENIGANWIKLFNKCLSGT